MLPSRATSIRSYRILNKAIYALSLTPGALEWASKRREIRKLFPQDSEILELLDKEMEPAIFQISRQILAAEQEDSPSSIDLTPSSSSTSSADENSDHTKNNSLALTAIQNALRRTFQLPHQEIFSNPTKYKAFLKEIVESAPVDKQYDLKKDLDALLSSSLHPQQTNTNNNKSSPCLLQHQIGLHRQKMIFEALRTLNSNVWFYSDRFWWRCFPVGAGIVMDKSTRWAQTPRELGDHITAAMTHHYTAMKKQEQQLSGRSPNEPLTIGKQLALRSNITQQAEKAAGASNLYATSGWRSGHTISTQQRLAHSALFRICFSAAGIHSRVADFASLNQASIELEYSRNLQQIAAQQHQSTISQQKKKENELGPDELQQERLVYHFPKLRQELIEKHNRNNIHNSSTQNNNKTITLVKFDPSQAVIAELYLRVRRALSFHYFFSELTSKITTFSPYEDWRFFLALLEANTREGIDRKVRELLHSLPEPSKISSFTELKEVTKRAHTQLFELLELNSADEDQISAQMATGTTKTKSHERLDGDAVANPLDENNKSEEEDVENLFLDDPEIDLFLAKKMKSTFKKNLEFTENLSGGGGARAFYRNENDNPTVEKVLSELPAEVLTRMIAHTVECCLQYSNECLADELLLEDSSSPSSSSSIKNQVSSNYVRTLLPIFTTTPGICPADKSCGCEPDHQGCCTQIPRLQHRLSLHGVTFLIAGVMARFGIPWRSMKGVPKMEPFETKHQQQPKQKLDDDHILQEKLFSSSIDESTSSSSVQDRRSTYHSEMLDQKSPQRHDDDFVVEEGKKEDTTSLQQDDDNKLQQEDYPRRKGYHRMTLQELEEIREIQQEIDNGAGGQQDDDEVVNFSAPSKTSSSPAASSEEKSDREKFMHFVDMKQKEQRKRKLLEERTKKQQGVFDVEENDDILGSLSSGSGSGLIGDLLHFATVDIEAEEASPPHYLELQLSGITLTEPPTKPAVDEVKENKNASSETEQNEVVDPEEILAAKMLAEKRLLENETEQQQAEGKSTIKKTTSSSSPLKPVISRHRLFPVFIDVYRTSPESPIISGSIVTPRHLARDTSNALILKYSNIRVMRGDDSKTGKNVSTSFSEKPIGADFAWSKGPRQDPILGLTSTICHAHLTKCEILAFDEIQGEDERSRHMTLLRDATALWTSVLQLF